MGKRIDITGQKFNMLTAIEPTNELQDRKVLWLCKCDCGNYTKATVTELKLNKKKSCGCFKYASRNYTHRLTKTRIYHIWQNMKRRCYEPKNISYKNYGARGIKICDEWTNDFMNFYNWAMANGYTDELTIDRKDVNGNYEPSNCKWSDNIEQGNNKRNTYFVIYQGEKIPISVLCRNLNIDKMSLYKRMKRGLSADEAVYNILNHKTKKIINSGQFKPSIFIEINGVNKSLPDWCREYNMPYTIALYRYKAGWDPLNIFTTPVEPRHPRH